MEFKPLQHPPAVYLAILNEWLTTPDLSHNEISLVMTLKQGLEKSIDDFDQLRRIAASPAFISTLKSAASKAIVAGKLTSWSQYAAAA